MSEIIKTVVSIANVEEVSELKGDFDAETVKNQMSGLFPYILNCTSTTTVEDGVRYITFAERLGTKG